MSLPFKGHTYFLLKALKILWVQNRVFLLKHHVHSVLCRPFQTAQHNFYLIILQTLLGTFYSF